MTVTEQEQYAILESVRVRPDKGNWGVVALFGVFSLFPLALFLSPRGMTIGQIWVPIGGWEMMTLVPALLLGVWQARAVVVANDEGLRWRGMGGWREAHWSDVTDYYEKVVAKAKPILIIETKAGQVRLGRNLWPEAPELRALVARQATTAKAQEWGVLGTRPDVDWPRVFDYNTMDNRFLSILLPVSVVLVVGYLLWIVSPGAVRTAAGLGWGWGLATFAIGGFGILPFGLFLAVFFRLQRATRRRKNQRLTLTRDGVLYEDQQDKVEAPWRDISDLYFARGKELSYHCVVVSRQGTFNFSPHIKDSAVLRRAFSTFATALPEAKWRTTESDVLGAETSRWASRCEGVGRRIYPYRTRTNRALLFLPTIFGLAPMLSVLLTQWTGGVVKGNPGFAYGITLLLGIPALLGWWRYWMAGIETDDMGITQRTLFGSRFLAWDKVEDYGKRGSDIFVFGVVQGAKTHVWFWLLIADVEELKAEIVRRARNSRNQTWDKDAEDE